MRPCTAHIHHPNPHPKGTFFPLARRLFQSPSLFAFVCRELEKGACHSPRCPSRTVPAPSTTPRPRDCFNILHFCFPPAGSSFFRLPIVHKLKSTLVAVRLVFGSITLHHAGRIPLTWDPSFSLVKSAFLSARHRPSVASDRCGVHHPRHCILELRPACAAVSSLNQHFFCDSLRDPPVATLKDVIGGVFSENSVSASTQIYGNF